MSRASKPGPDASLRQALAYVGRHPRLWPRFAALMALHVAAKGRFYIHCWRAGYRVRTVRRLARAAGE